MKPSIRPPAHVEPYVNILGEERAVAFFLAFGGAELHFAQTPARWGHIAAAVGDAGAAALAVAGSRLPKRVPTAKPYLARVLFAWGTYGGAKMSKAAIARLLHVSDETVRRYLDEGAGKRSAPTYRDDQPDLFG